MTEVIRCATTSDYETIIELLGDFVNDKARFGNFDSDSFHRVINSDNAYVYVYCDFGEIIGFITFSIRSVIRYPRPIMEVDEIFVSQQWRRKGVGRSLIQKAIDIGKQKQCYYVFLASDKKRVQAHEFHQSLGFIEYGLHYRLLLL